VGVDPGLGCRRQAEGVLGTRVFSEPRVLGRACPWRNRCKLRGEARMRVWVWVCPFGRGRERVGGCWSACGCGWSQLVTCGRVWMLVSVQHVTVE
jgi:hypothetical protein